MQWCQARLGVPGKERDMAALLLGRLLPRSDMHAALQAFLSWARSAVSSAGADAVFVLPGEYCLTILQ